MHLVLWPYTSLLLPSPYSMIPFPVSCLSRFKGTSMKFNFTCKGLIIFIYTFFGTLPMYFTPFLLFYTLTLLIKLLNFCILPVFFLHQQFVSYVLYFNCVSGSSDSVAGVLQEIRCLSLSFWTHDWRLYIFFTDLAPNMSLVTRAGNAGASAYYTLSFLLQRHFRAYSISQCCR